MLTLNGTPLPGVAVEPILAEALSAPKAEVVKREESKLEDARITSFVLPIAPPKNAEPGHLDGRPFLPHEREYPARAIRSAEAKPIAPPPWMKKN